MSNQLHYAYVETRRRVHRVMVDGSGGFASRERCNLDAGNEPRFAAATPGAKRHVPG